jgi:hypothetical protein
MQTLVTTHLALEVCLVAHISLTAATRTSASHPLVSATACNVSSARSAALLHTLLLMKAVMFDRASVIACCRPVPLIYRQEHALKSVLNAVVVYTQQALATAAEAVTLLAAAVAAAALVVVAVVLLQVLLDV